MSYTEALYYPTIDIKNEEWLKNAILFWDKIFTIAPKSTENPYMEATSSALASNGVIEPIWVSSEDAIVNSLVKKISAFSKKSTALEFLIQGKDSKTNPYSDARSYFSLHHDKLPIIIQSMLSQKNLIDDDGWVRVNENFADFYMTLLATSYAKQKHLILLADDKMNFDLSNSFAWDIEQKKLSSSHQLLLKNKAAEEMLFNLVIDGIKINPLTSVDDLLKFKDRRKDELSVFRRELSRLTEGLNLDDVESLEELQGIISSVYKNDFLPSLNNLKRTLSDSNISWIENIENFVATLFSSIQLALTTHFLPCIPIGVGWSLIAVGMKDTIKKRSIKRHNPYSYMLSLANENIITY